MGVAFKDEEGDAEGRGSRVCGDGGQAEERGVLGFRVREAHVLSLTDDEEPVEDLLVREARVADDGASALDWLDDL